MGEIIKGKIASIKGNTARVVPLDATGKPTPMITIPWHLRGESGDLKKDMLVVCVLFGDGTGLLLGRADGEWGGYIPALGAHTVQAVSIIGDEIKSEGISLKSHTHGGVTTGGGTTSEPK